MHPDSIRSALAMIYVSLCEATALATGKPVGQLSGHLLREMTDGASSAEADLCRFLAECTDPSDNGWLRDLESAAAH
jgi:hypothetical protein